MYCVTLLLCKSGDLLLLAQFLDGERVTTLHEFERVRWRDMRSGEDLEEALQNAVMLGEEGPEQPSGSDSEFLPYMAAAGARSAEDLHAQVVAAARVQPAAEDWVEWVCSVGRLTPQGYEMSWMMRIDTTMAIPQIAEVALDLLRQAAEPPKKARKRWGRLKSGAVDAVVVAVHRELFRYGKPGSLRQSLLASVAELEALRGCRKDGASLTVAPSTKRILHLKLQDFTSEHPELWARWSGEVEAFRSELAERGLELELEIG